MRRLKSLAAICCGAIMLTACSMLPYGPQVQGIAHEAEITAVKDRRNFNDDKAQLTAIALCDMSVGSFYRIGNPAIQYGTIAICSGKLPGNSLDLKPVNGTQPEITVTPPPQPQ